jgi:hypothetical protein
MARIKISGSDPVWTQTDQNDNPITTAFLPEAQAFGGAVVSMVRRAKSAHVFFKRRMLLSPYRVLAQHFD